MAVRFSELQCLVTANNRDFERKMAQSEQTAKTKARGIQAALSSIKSVTASVNITGGLFGGGRGASDVLARGGLVVDSLKGIFNALTSVQQSGLQYHKTLENASLGFETLMKSADGARKHLQDLEKFSLRSPFEFGDVIGASLKMQAFGHQTKEVMRDMTAYGDIATLMALKTGNFGEALDGVASALGKMRSQGRLSAEEMEMLVDRGVPAWELLAKYTGQSVANLRKMSESGALRGDIGAKLLTRIFEKEYGGLAERASRTTSGRESNLSDQYNKFAYETIKNGTVKGYDAAIEEITKQLGSADALKFAQKTDFVTATGLQGVLDVLKGGGTNAAIYDAAVNVGKRIYEGMIQSEVKGLGDWIGKKFQEGVDLAKSVWDIQSPSKVAEQIGLNVAEGYALGLDRGTDLFVSTAMQRLLSGGLSRRQQAEEWNKDPRIRAMLDTLAKSEGANYNTLFGGGRFDDFSVHPNRRITRKLGGKPLTSTAAGRYQFLSRTWAGVAGQLGLTDFSPHSQDLAAIELMRQRGMIPKILSGDIAGALTAGNREWASLPGSPYGQPTHAAQKLIDVYNQALGQPSQVLSNAAAALERAAHAQLSLVERYALYNPGSAVASKGGAALPTSPLAQAQSLGQLFGGGDSVTIAANLERIPLALDTLGNAAQLNLRKLIPLPPALEGVALGMGNVGTATAKLDEEIKELVKKLTQSNHLESLQQRYTAEFNDLLNGLTQHSEDAMDLVKNFARNFITTTLREMEMAFVERATGQKGGLAGLLGNTLGSLLGGFLGFSPKVPGKAAGGPVMGNHLYKVGERGEEFFVPSVNGRILSNSDARQALTEAASGRRGATQSIVINFHVNAPDGRISRESQSQAAARLAQVLKQADARNS